MRHAQTFGNFVVAVAVFALVSGCARKPDRRARIVASTTLIATITEQVGGGRFAVTTIAPAGLCPGHFDIKPSDILAANQAQLLLNHGWEAWFPKLEQALVKPGPRKVTLKTQGNWMVPPVQVAATREIAALLGSVDAANARLYLERADVVVAQVESAGAVAHGLFANQSLPAVIAADKQKPFLEWLGFRVLASYGRPEEFTAQELTRLARVIVDSGVGLIVDNLQSGPDAGRSLAEAAGIKQVTLSNFPLEGSYSKTLMSNADTLAKLVR